MTIRHPLRWSMVVTILFLGGTIAASRWLDAPTFARLTVLLYLGGALVSLFVNAHLRGAVPSLLTVAAVLVAGTAAGWFVGMVDVGWWLRWLLAGFVLLPVMSVANAAYRADVRRAQRRREASAASLVRQVRTGEPAAPFALYLRPFVTTDRLGAQAFAQEIPGSSETPVHLDVETVMTRSLRGVMPVIGLGRPGEMDEGVARVVTSEEEWRDVVQALARRAQIVMMVPLARPSTLWELQWLLENDLLRKVLFVMPEVPYEAPNGVFIRKEHTDRLFDAGIRVFDPEAHRLDLQKEWSRATDAAARFGLHLPPLAAVGGLFTLDPASGAVKNILPLGLSTIHRPVRYIREAARLLGLLEGRPWSGGKEALYTWAVLYGDRTMEFALMRAADGSVLWDDVPSATRLMQRSLEEGGRRPVFAPEYLAALPKLVQERLTAGDQTAARRYVQFARALRQDATLGAWVSHDAIDALDALVASSSASTSATIPAPG